MLISGPRIHTFVNYDLGYNYEMTNSLFSIGETFVRNHWLTVGIHNVTFGPSGMGLYDELYVEYYDEFFLQH